MNNLEFYKRRISELEEECVKKQNEINQLEESCGRMKAKVDTYNNYLLLRCTKEAKELIDKNHFSAVKIVTLEQWNNHGKADGKVYFPKEYEQTVREFLNIDTSEIQDDCHRFGIESLQRYLKNPAPIKIPKRDDKNMNISDIQKCKGQDLSYRYSLTDEEYKFLEEHFEKPELLWKYKRALEEADEEKEEKFRYVNLYLELQKAFEDVKKEHDCQVAEYQSRTEKDKTELERAKTTINQIDDILEKLFDVRHDTVDKTDEFEKILSERAKGNVTDFLPTEPIKVADMLINAEGEYEHNPVVKKICGTDKGTYRIFEISELRQIAEHLLVYCNHNREAEEC